MVESVSMRQRARVWAGLSRLSIGSPGRRPSAAPLADMGITVGTWACYDCGREALMQGKRRLLRALALVALAMVSMAVLESMAQTNPPQVARSEHSRNAAP